MGAATGCRLSINEEIMPTKKEIWHYERGYAAGFKAGLQVDPWAKKRKAPGEPFFEMRGAEYFGDDMPIDFGPDPRKKRKLSAWNKFVKANSKKPRFKYRNGKLNLKKMAVAFRKTPAGKKKRR